MYLMLTRYAISFYKFAKSKQKRIILFTISIAGFRSSPLTCIPFTIRPSGHLFPKFLFTLYIVFNRQDNSFSNPPTEDCTSGRYDLGFPLSLNLAKGF